MDNGDQIAYGDASTMWVIVAPRPKYGILDRKISVTYRVSECTLVLPSESYLSLTPY
jgi:hypothetical protein